MTKIYVTKYALDGGIFEAVVSVDTGDGWIRYFDSEGFIKTLAPKQHSYSLDGAKEIAEEMRTNELKRLESEIKRLSALKF